MSPVATHDVRRPTYERYPPATTTTRTPSRPAVVQLLPDPSPNVRTHINAALHTCKSSGRSSRASLPSDIHAASTVLVHLFTLCVDLRYDMRTRCYFNARSKANVIFTARRRASAVYVMALYVLTMLAMLQDGRGFFLNSTGEANHGVKHNKKDLRLSTNNSLGLYLGNGQRQKYV